MIYRFCTRNQATSSVDAKTDSAVQRCLREAVAFLGCFEIFDVGQLYPIVQS